MSRENTFPSPQGGGSSLTSRPCELAPRCRPGADLALRVESRSRLMGARFFLAGCESASKPTLPVRSLWIRDHAGAVPLTDQRAGEGQSFGGDESRKAEVRAQ